MIKTYKNRHATYTDNNFKEIASICNDKLYKNKK